VNVKDALSAAKIVALRVPGWPTSERRVRARLDREEIAYRGLRGRGGNGGKRREYFIATLPEALRTAYAGSLISASARAGRIEGAKLQLTEKMAKECHSNRRLSGLKNSVNQSAPGQSRIDAKLQLLLALDRFRRTAGLNATPAQHEFSSRYNRAEIEVEPWIRELAPQLSAVSLMRWEKTIKREGVARLGGNYGNRRGESIIDRQPELMEFAIAMLVSHPHCSSSHVMQSMRARFNGHNALEYPSPRALQRWVTRWKEDNKQVFSALTNPDSWKNKSMAAFGSQSDGIERVNQRWELDSTPGDVMLTDGRHSIIGVIDVFPRRGKLLVSKTSKGTSIATLLRHALLGWGVPEIAKTDNGTDYVGNHITRVFAALEVEQQLCPPFQPWHKPHIERFFGTFSHDLVELLPGFIGHNVAERSAIEARASFADRLMKRGGVLDVSMSSAEFQQFCDKWCEDVYLHRAHEGLKGKTPFEIIAASRETTRAITDPRALDILLADAPGNNGLRTVQKKGIELDNAWFIAQELGTYIGTQVHVRYDPVDLGRLYVFDIEAGFICVAECPERTGMDRREVAIKAKAIQLADVQEQRRALKATAKRAKTDDIVTEILTERAEAAGKLTRLPGPTMPHQSAGLAAAGAAVRARRVPTGAPDTPEEAAERAAFNVQPIRTKVEPRDEAEECWERYRRALALEARIATAEPVTDEERHWTASYQHSPEYRALKRMATDFPQKLQARQAG
jgi:putative transposase